METADLPASTDVLCRVCEAPVARSGTTICDACDRYRCRHEGLTPCCGTLRLTVDGQSYCPACPGPGRVPIVFVFEGRERIGYHPAGARLSLAGSTDRLTLADLADRRRCRVSELVLTSADARSWALRRLRVTIRSARRRWIKFKCDTCGLNAGRWIAVNRKASHRCDPCRQKRRKAIHLRAVKAYFQAQADAGVDCDSCKKPANRLFGLREGVAFCSECWRRCRQVGRCSKCRGPLSRVNARLGRGTFCPRCDPAPRHLRTAVTVTLIDGTGATADLKVSATSDLGRGRFASGWWGPLVFVDRLPAPGQLARLRSAPVIGGVYVRHTGPTVRLAVGVLAEAAPRSRAEATALLTRELGAADSGPAIAGLLRSGLLDDSGLTDKARALVAWAKAAGVPL